jgi:hypothetical protein
LLAAADDLIRHLREQALSERAPSAGRIAYCVRASRERNESVDARNRAGIGFVTPSSRGRAAAPTLLSRKRL